MEDFRIIMTDAKLLIFNMIFVSSPATLPPIPKFATLVTINPILPLLVEYWWLTHVYPFGLLHV
jgi:hypothetical protein